MSHSTFRGSAHPLLPQVLLSCLMNWVYTHCWSLTFEVQKHKMKQVLKNPFCSTKPWLLTILTSVRHTSEVKTGLGLCSLSAHH